MKGLLFGAGFAVAVRHDSRVSFAFPTSAICRSNVVCSLSFRQSAKSSLTRQPIGLLTIAQSDDWVASVLPIRGPSRPRLPPRLQSCP
jgi:hypothetical protein